MVRINLLNPKKLSDQHLIAEYDEMLMLVSYIKNHPRLENIPQKYCLGKGHMKFFKDKLLYLKKRHESIKSEMKKRGFRTRKTIFLRGFKRQNKNDWRPKKEDLKTIKKRLIEKIKLKPEFYRYYGKYKPANFFIKLTNRSH